jgi:hypothetical protein
MADLVRGAGRGFGLVGVGGEEKRPVFERTGCGRAVPEHPEVGHRMHWMLWTGRKYGLGGWVVFVRMRISRTTTEALYQQQHQDRDD